MSTARPTSIEVDATLRSFPLAASKDLVLDNRSGIGAMHDFSNTKGESVATIKWTSDEVLAALTELVSVLADPDKRKSLAESTDFAATLQEAGVTVEYIPERVLSGLASASEEELEFLSSSNEALVASGLSVEVPKGSLGIL